MAKLTDNFKRGQSNYNPHKKKNKIWIEITAPQQEYHWEKLSILLSL
jgi:hypothetical protein